MTRFVLLACCGCWTPIPREPTGPTLDAVDVAPLPAMAEPLRRLPDADTSECEPAHEIEERWLWRDLDAARAARHLARWTEPASSCHVIANALLCQIYLGHDAGHASKVWSPEVALRACGAHLKHRPDDADRVLVMAAISSWPRTYNGPDPWLREAELAAASTLGVEIGLVALENHLRVLDCQDLDEVRVQRVAARLMIRARTADHRNRARRVGDVALLGATTQQCRKRFAR